ncbi:MAG: HAD family phosphatase [Erysipelotrichaceae bacterium]|nr:HAD family phosphatase [Erysipelotrichaceae bacterium]
MIECVIFDLDGLMIDSEVITRRVFSEEGKKLGFELDEKFFNGVIGTAKNSSKAQFERFPNLINSLDTIIERRKEAVLYEAKNNPLFYKKGLFILLDYLFENNYKVCVATSSFLDTTTKILSAMPYQYNFDAICTGDMVTHHKPNPEVFLLAASKASVEPKKCLVLEDSRNGIIAAKNAEMTAAFIYDTIKPDDYIKSLFDYDLESLEDVIDVLKTY